MLLSFRPSLLMCLSRPLRSSFLSLGLIGTTTFFITVWSVAPIDLKHGLMARIPYVHVPAARVVIWLYGFSSVASLLGLVSKHPLVHWLGARFMGMVAMSSVLVLLTGWFRGWNQWCYYWYWDARLTSVLLSFQIALGSLVLQKLPVKLAPFSILAGTLDLPLLTSSVNWWNTTHQPGSISRSGTAIHEPLAYPLWFNVAFPNCSAFLLVVLETRLSIPYQPYSEPDALPL